MVDLDRIERLAAEATPGPWVAEGGAVTDAGNPETLIREEPRLWAEVMGGDGEAAADAEFIAACDPATVLALTRAVRAALGFVYGEHHPHTAAHFVRLTGALAPFRGPVAAAGKRED